MMGSDSWQLALSNKDFNQIKINSIQIRMRKNTHAHAHTYAYQLLNLNI